MSTTIQAYRLLSIFRTNQAYAGFLLLFYALLLQLPSILGGIEVVPETSRAGIFGSWMMQRVGAQGWLALLLPAGLLLIQGILANTLVTRHRLARTVNQFPGLFLVLTWGLVPAFRWLHPLQAANVFLLFGLLALGRLYKREEPAVPLFNAGAWLGLASFFSPSYLLFLPAFFIAVGVMRSPDFRSLFQLLIGPLLLYFLAAVFTYAFGDLGDFVRLQFGQFTVPQLAVASQNDLLALGLLALLVLVVLTFAGTLKRVLNMEGTKGVNILYWTLLFSLPVALFSAGVTAADAQAIIVPLGVLLGLVFTQLPPNRAEFWHFLLLAAALLPGLLYLFI